MMVRGRKRLRSCCLLVTDENQSERRLEVDALMQLDGWFLAAQNPRLFVSSSSSSSYPSCSFICRNNSVNSERERGAESRIGSR